MEQTTSTADDAQLVKFFVNNKAYSIPLQHITDFPIKDAYLNNLLSRSLSVSATNISTELTPNGEIIIKAYDKTGHMFRNFDLIVKIYANPNIKLKELLHVESFLDLIKEVHDSQPKPTSSRGHPNDRKLNYPIIDQSDSNLIVNHPGYSYLIDVKYKSLIREFRFYGIEELVNPRNNVEIDINGITRDVRNNLKSMFLREVKCERYHCDHWGNGRCFDPTTCSNNIKLSDIRIIKFNEFLRAIKQMSGVISGSSVLAPILKEKWVVIKDIDVYVTETNFFEYVLENIFRLETESYGPEIGYSERFKIITQLRDRYKSYGAKIFNSMDPNSYVNKEFGSKLFAPEMTKDRLGAIKDKVIEMFDKNIKTEMIEALKHLLKAADIKLISKDDLEGSYNSHNGIKYVLRIIMYTGLIIDFVVTKCTIPFVIDMFDFDFNKIYYDGYSVSCLDWKAVMTKYTSNFMDISIENGSLDRDCLRYGTHEYVYNIDRIRKYFDRGFIITIRSKSKEKLEPEDFRQINMP